MSCECSQNHESIELANSASELNECTLFVVQFEPTHLYNVRQQNGQTRRRVKLSKRPTDLLEWKLSTDNGCLNVVTTYTSHTLYNTTNEHLHLRVRPNWLPMAS